MITRQVLSKEAGAILTTDWISRSLSLKAHANPRRSDCGGPCLDGNLLGLAPLVRLPHPRHRDRRIHEEEHLSLRSFARDCCVHCGLYAPERPDEGRFEIFIG